MIMHASVKFSTSEKVQFSALTTQYFLMAVTEWLEILKRSENAQERYAF